MRVIKSKSDSWATPLELFDKLNSEFNFNFDPCPYNEGEISEENDGLKIDWGTRNFVNPPYSQPLKWLFVKKGIEESKKGKLCVFLLPTTGFSTAFFHDEIIPNLSEPIRFVRGRVKFEKFIEGERVPMTQPIQDSMVLIFNGNR